MSNQNTNKPKKNEYAKEEIHFTRSIYTETTKGALKEKNNKRRSVANHKKHQLFQHVIGIQLGYQSERGKKSDPYQNVGIVIMVYLTIDGV
jgi:hypothetical protein